LAPDASETGLSGKICGVQDPRLASRGSLPCDGVDGGLGAVMS
jgi:hypothetical protein